MHSHEALLAFSQLPLASQSVFANHFVAWRSFCSHLEAKGKKETFSQPISKFENHFIIKRPFSQQMEDFTGGSYGAAKGSFAAHFDAWSIFVAILKLGDHFIAILKFGNHFTSIWKFGNHLATKLEFRSPFFKLGAFLQRGVDFAEEGNFCSPFHSCEMGAWVLRSGTRVPKGGFAAAKHPSKWGRGCEVKKFPLWLCAVRLQTVITSSF